MKLKAGSIVALSKDNSSEPQFGEVKEILVTKQDTILLGLRLLLVLEYSEHYYSWVVERTSTLALWKATDIPFRQVLTLHHVRGASEHSFFITLKHAL